MDKTHHVVIIGAGFGGIQAAMSLKKVNVKITIIDKNNYHLFQPLLYQAATALLAPSEIAWPIRYLMRKRPEITTLLSTVIGINKQDQYVILECNEKISYDTLIVATGARHAYFGNDNWSEYAPGLKVLEDATYIRKSILTAFENAELETDKTSQESLINFIVIGGGPTGVELAGTIAELARHTLKNEYRNFNSENARVILIEAAPRVLPSFAKNLSEYACTALEKLGVEVLLGKPVINCDDSGVDLENKRIEAKTIIWAAGVQASPAANWLDLEHDKFNRVIVKPDLSVTDHPEIFVIGDTASIKYENGALVPGTAPAAKQQGRYVAQVVKSRLTGCKSHKPFKYIHYGDLATIGKGSAVFDIGWLKLRGRLAWWLWGLTHIYFLIGLRNKISVSLHWLWIYFKGDRGARIIT